MEQFRKALNKDLLFDYICLAFPDLSNLKLIAGLLVCFSFKIKDN